MRKAASLVGSFFHRQFSALGHYRYFHELQDTADPATAATAEAIVNSLAVDITASLAEQPPLLAETSRNIASYFAWAYCAFGLSVVGYGMYCFLRWILNDQHHALLVVMAAALVEVVFYRFFKTLTRLRYSPEEGFSSIVPNWLSTLIAAIGVAFFVSPLPKNRQESAAASQIAR